MSTPFKMKGMSFGNSPLSQTKDNYEKDKEGNIIHYGDSNNKLTLSEEERSILDPKRSAINEATNKNDWDATRIDYHNAVDSILSARPK